MNFLKVLSMVFTLQICIICNAAFAVIEGEQWGYVIISSFAAAAFCTISVMWKNES